MRVFVKNKIQTQSGFTLVELMVVLVIMSLFLTVLFAGYNRFGVKLTLQNVAFTLATTIREAQIFGAFGKYQNFDEFEPVPVGVRVETTSANLDGRFVLFMDSNEDKKLQTEEIIKDSRLRSGYGVSGIKAYDSGTVKNLNSVYIFFKRPYSDAAIYDNYGNKYSELEIIMSSPYEDKLAVFVNAAGQISVRRVNQ